MNVQEYVPTPVVSRPAVELSDGSIEPFMIGLIIVLVLALFLAIALVLRRRSRENEAV